MHAVTWSVEEKYQITHCDGEILRDGKPSILKHRILTMPRNGWIDKKIIGADCMSEVNELVKYMKETLRDPDQLFDCQRQCLQS